MDLHSPQPESNDIKNSCSVVPTRIRQIFSHKCPINHLAILVLRFDLHALISLMLQSLMKKIVGTTQTHSYYYTSNNISSASYRSCNL